MYLLHVYSFITSLLIFSVSLCFIISWLLFLVVVVDDAVVGIFGTAA